MQQEKDCNYFATRKMGRQLLKSPYDTTWWNSSKYRLCLHRFDPLPPDARVLDLGCGLGQTAYFLAEVSGEVTGIDLSAFAIQFAMENYERPNLRFVQADIFVYEPEVLADAVFCMDLIEHLDQQEGQKLLRRILGFLKPGGRLYAHVPIAQSVAGIKKLEKYKRNHPDHGPVIDHTGDPTHKTTFSVPSFRELLEKCGFIVTQEIRKVHCWRPFRWFYRGFLKLPMIPTSWQNRATYSYIVIAQPSLISDESQKY
jgi:SAM-dependent methyltransferase